MLYESCNQCYRYFTHGDLLYSDKHRYGCLCETCATIENAKLLTDKFVPVFTYENQITTTREVAATIVGLADAGLSCGMGSPNPGDMCVEAAVCYALGLPFSDNPPCVADIIRIVKITINDCDLWQSSLERGKGMKRIAIAQLGSTMIDSDTWFTSVMNSFNRDAISRLTLPADQYMGDSHPDNGDDGGEYIEEEQRILYYVRKLLNSYEYNTQERLDTFSDNVLELLTKYANLDQNDLCTLCEICVQACITAGTDGAQWLDLAPLAEVAA